MFLNQNWVGEDSVNMLLWPDNHYHSTIRLDTIGNGSGVVVQARYYTADSIHYSSALAPEKMRVFISDNINYYDPMLTSGYYESSVYVIDTLGTPPSYLMWLGLGSGPWKIGNQPCEWKNDHTSALFTTYAPPRGGFMEKRTYTGTITTTTPAIADASVVTAVAQWNQNQYGDPRFSTAANILHSKYIYGDYDPTTIPGSKTENGKGITKFTDVNENFNQSEVLSHIDGLPIGSLIWDDARLDVYNSAEDYQEILLNYLVNTGIGSAQTNSGIPAKLELAQNFPNPFNLSTQVSYIVPEKKYVTLKVFNVLGQQVATLFAGTQTRGTHTASFDGTGFPSGVYFCRLQAGGLTQTRKMILMK